MRAIVSGKAWWRAALVAWAIVAWPCDRAAAAFFAEIATATDNGVGQYVEFVPGPEARTIELVVLNAVPGDEGRVLGVHAIDVPAAKRTALLLEGHVPAPDPAVFQQVDDIDLGQAMGAARRLALFDGVTGWRADQIVASPAHWHADPQLPQVLDLVTLAIDGVFDWSARSLRGEAVIDLDAGQTVWRSHTADLPIGPYHVIAADAAVASPGLVNVADTPEPGAATLAMCGAAWLLSRRRR